MRKTIAIMLLLVLGLTGLGCVAVSKYATPAPKASEAALKYGYEAGILDPNSYRGYANLEKAERLEVALESAYQVYTLGLEHATERHELDYGVLAKVAAANTKKGRATETAFFSEKGIIPLVAGLAGFGGLGSLIGLMRKRPGDITPQDMELALGGAGVKLKDKERQMLEIVRGIQAHLDTDPPDAAMLKGHLERKQSADTRVSVAALKVT